MAAAQAVGHMHNAMVQSHLDRSGANAAAYDDSLAPKDKQYDLESYKALFTHDEETAKTLGEAANDPYFLVKESRRRQNDMYKLKGSPKNPSPSSSTSTPSIPGMGTVLKPFDFTYGATQPASRTKVSGPEDYTGITSGTLNPMNSAFAQQYDENTRQLLKDPIYGEIIKAQQHFASPLPLEYDGDKVIFGNPVEEESKANKWFTWGVRKFIESYERKNKVDLSKEEEELMMSFLVNGAIHTANDEGIIDAVVSSHTQARESKRNPYMEGKVGSPDAGSRPDDKLLEIRKDPEFQSLLNGYTGRIDGIRKLQGAISRFGLKPVNGKYSIDYKKFEDESEWGNVVASGLSTFSTIAQPLGATLQKATKGGGRNAQEMQGQHLSPVGAYLLRPTLFVEPGNTTDTELKQLFINNLTPQQKAKMAQDGYHLDPTFAEELTAMAPPLLTSMFMGPLRWGSAAASGTVNAGKGLFEIKSVQRGLEAAKNVMARLTPDDMVAAINKTPAGKKAVAFLQNMFKMTLENASQTALTFAYASAFENGDELTDEELFQSAKMGSAYGLFGTPLGMVGSWFGARAAQMTKGYRGSIAALERGKVDPLMPVAKNALKRNTENILANGRELGYYVGQIPANVGQGLAAQALTNPDFDMWSNQNLANMAQDFLLAGFFGAKQAKRMRDVGLDMTNLLEHSEKLSEAVIDHMDVTKKAERYQEMQSDVMAIPDNAGSKPIDHTTPEFETVEPVAATKRSMTVKEYAQEHGIGEAAVRARIKRGTLDATKNGKTYTIEVDVPVQDVTTSAVPEAQPRLYEGLESATVADISKDLPFRSDAVGELQKALLDNVADLPVQFDDGAEIKYLPESNTIVIGRNGLHGNADYAKRQVLEEITHAMTVDALDKNPEAKAEVQTVIDALRADKTIQREIDLDNRAATMVHGKDEQGNNRQGTLDYYLSSPEEFVAGMMTGKLAEVKDIVDRKFGEGAWRKMLATTGADKALSKVSPVFQTAENVDRIIEKLFVREKMQPVTTDEPLDTEGLFTWRASARKATLPSDPKGITPDEIAVHKELTGNALKTGLPESFWLDVAQRKSTKPWDKLTRKERAQEANKWANAMLDATENGIQRDVENAIVNRLQRLQTMVQETDTKTLQDNAATSHFIKHIGDVLGFESGRNARAWIASQLKNEGYKQSYVNVKARYDMMKQYLPEQFVEAYDKVFDKAWSQLMLQMGHTEPAGVVSVKWDKENKQLLVRKGTGREQVYARTAMRDGLDSYANDLRTSEWSKNIPLVKWWADAMQKAELFIAPDMKKELENMVMGPSAVRKVRETLEAEGLYVLPNKLEGPTMLDWEGFIKSITNEIDKIYPDRDANNNMLWRQKKESVERMIEDMEQMVWWKVLDSDSRWAPGDKPDMKLLSGLNLHKVLEDTRTGKYGKAGIHQLFVDKGEAFKAMLDKNAEETYQSISRIGAMLDTMLTSGGTKMQPISKVAIARNQNPNNWSEAMAWGFRRVMDNMMVQMVDPGGKTFVEGGKMASKYFQHFVGADYHAYKDLDHIDEILRGTSHRPLQYTGEGTPEEHDQWLNSLGLFRKGEDLVQRVAVINDDIAAMIPGMDKILGTKRASKFFDGGSCYINPRTRDLHAAMLGKEGDQVGGIKPAWYANQDGMTHIWKTGGHTTLLDLMGSAENPEAAAFFENLAQQGISMVTFESSKKSDGAWRHRNMRMKDGTTLKFDDKGRVKGIDQNGKVKALGTEDVLKYHAMIFDQMAKGNIASGIVDEIPLTGNKGLRLLNASDPVETLNGTPLGTNDLPVTLPNDMLGKAYELAMPMIQRRNQEAADYLSAAQGLISEKGDVDLRKNPMAGRIFQDIRQRLSSESAGKRNIGYADPILQQEVINRLDMLADANGIISQERLAAFRTRYPGIFSRAVSDVPAEIEYLMANTADTASKSKMQGVGQMWLQPMAAPMDATSRGAEYLGRLFESNPEEGVIRAARIGNLIANGSEDGRIPPLYDKKTGQVTAYHPYVFVTQDFLDRANAQRMADNKDHSTEPVELLGPGSKTIMVLTPTDSAGSVVPVIVAGVIPGVNKISASDEILRDTMGRDYDADGIGLGYDSYHWYKDGASTYEDYWNELYDKQVAKNVGKPIENELKLGKSLDEKETQELLGATDTNMEAITTGGQPAVRAVDWLGKPLPYHYKANKPLDLNYSVESILAGTNAIGMGMARQKSFVAASRMAEQMNAEPSPIEGGHVRFGHDPAMNSQMSVWRQNLVDSYDKSNYNMNDLFMSSVIRELAVNDKPMSYADLGPNQKKEVQMAFQGWLNKYGIKSPHDKVVREGAMQQEALQKIAVPLPSAHADLVQRLGTNARALGTTPPKPSSVLNKNYQASIDPVRAEAIDKDLAQTFVPYDEYVRELQIAGGADDHAFFHRAYAGAANAADKAVGDAVLMSLFKGGHFVTKQLTPIALDNNTQLVSLNNEFFFRGKDSEGKPFEIPVTHAFDVYGRVTPAASALIPVTSVSDVAPYIMGKVTTTRVDNKNARYAAMAKNNPNRFYIAFQSGSYAGDPFGGAPNSAVVQKQAGLLGKPVQGPMEVVLRAAEWLQANPHGAIVMHQNAAKGDDIAMENMRATLATLQRLIPNAEPKIKTRAMDKEQRGQIAGTMAGIMGQQMGAGNPIKASVYATRYLTRAMDAMGKDPVKPDVPVIEPSFDAYLSGVTGTGIIPRHPSGETLSSVIYDQFVAQAQEQPLVVPDNNGEPAVEPEPLPADGKSPRVLHAWTRGGKGAQSPNQLDPAIDAILGEKGRKRTRKAMDALRIATGGMKSMTDEEYGKVFDDVSRVFEATFGGRLSKEMIASLKNSMSPLHYDHLMSQMTVYNDLQARELATTVMFMQALNAGEKAVRDLKSVVSQGELDTFRQRMALRFQNYFNPLRRQSDSELVRMASNKKGFYGAATAFHANVGMVDGMPMAMGVTPVTVDMTYDPLLHLRNGMIYDAAPNVEYLTPQSSIHALKDSIQQWLDIGSKDILDSENTTDRNDTTWKQWMREMGLGEDVVYDDRVAADTMRWIGESLTDKGTVEDSFIDMSGFKFRTLFDGSSASSVTVSYGDKSFTWGGVLDPAGKEAINNMISQMMMPGGAIRYGIKDFGRTDGLNQNYIRHSLKRLVLTMANNKLLGNQVKSMAQQHGFWLGSKQQHFNGSDEEWALLDNLVTQNIKNMNEIGDMLLSDDPREHQLLNLNVDRNALFDMMTQFIDESAQAGDAAMQDEVYALLADAVYGPAKASGDKTLAANRQKAQANRGRALFNETLNWLHEDNVRFLAPILGTDTPPEKAAPFYHRRNAAKLMEILGKYYGRELEYSLGARRALLHSEFEGMMFGINDAMKTGYMAEYGKNETTIARTAALSRFDLNGYIYDRQVNPMEIAGLLREKGYALTEQEHGLATGHALTLQYKDGNGRIVRNNGRFLGFTNIKAQPLQNKVARTMLDEIQKKGDSATPEEKAWAAQLTDDTFAENKPAVIFYKNDPVEKKGKMVMVPLDQVATMYAGDKLGMMGKWAERKARENAQKVIDGLRGQMMGAPGDPIEMLGADFTKFLYVNPADSFLPDGSTPKVGVKYFGSKAEGPTQAQNLRKDFAKSFFAEMGYNDLSPRHQKYMDYLAEANRRVSWYLYGGGRNLINTFAGLGLAGVGAVTGIGAIPGLAMAGYSAAKLIGHHMLHIKGNQWGGGTRAWQLDMPAIGGLDFLSSKKDQKTTPAMSMATANRFGKSGTYMDDMFTSSSSAERKYTAQLEREASTLRILEERGMLQMPVGDVTRQEALSIAEERLNKVLKDLKDISLNVSIDPNTKEKTVNITSASGKTLNEMEEMNLDALNMALTFVNGEKVSTFRERARQLAQVGLSPLKWANKRNSVMFSKVTESEYTGALDMGAILEKNYESNANLAKMGGSPMDVAVDKVLRINYISRMQDEIMGKFTERNPYHGTLAGRLGTLFSQWSRNFFIQGTEGMAARQNVMAEIHKTLMQDPKYVKAVEDVVTMGGRVKGQGTSLRRMLGVGLIANLDKIVLAASALSAANILDEEDTKKADALMYEYRDWVQYANRLLGFDNGPAAIAYGFISSMASALGIGSENMKPGKEWKAVDQIVGMAGDIAGSGGLGVGSKAAYDLGEIFPLYLYARATDTTYTWDKFYRDVTFKTQGLMTTNPVTFPVAMVVSTAREVEKNIPKPKKASKKSTGRGRK